MAISRISYHQADATSVTITTPQSGDYIVVFAFKNNSGSSAPGLISGYTNIGSQSGNTCYARAMYKVSDGTETSTGTSTGCTNIIAVIFRGVKVTTPMGTPAGQGSSGNTITYNAPAAVLNSDGSSWYIAVGAHRGATNVGSFPPTNCSLVTNNSDVWWFCSGTGLSSFSTYTTGTLDSTLGRVSMVWEMQAEPASVTVTPAQGSLTATGYYPGLETELQIPINNLTVTGYAPTINTSTATIVPIGLGTLTATGQVPNIKAIVNVPKGDLTVTGYIPLLKTTVPIGKADLTITSYTPPLRLAVPIGLGALSITGRVPTIASIGETRIVPPQGDLIINSFSPILPIYNGISPLTMECYAPNVITTDNKWMLPPTANLTLETFLPSVDIGIDPVIGYFRRHLRDVEPNPQVDETLTYTQPTSTDKDYFKRHLRDVAPGEGDQID